jgi:hypothetical protein
MTSNKNHFQIFLVCYISLQALLLVKEDKGSKDVNINCPTVVAVW